MVKEQKKRNKIEQEKIKINPHTEPHTLEELNFNEETNRKNANNTKIHLPLPVGRSHSSRRQK